MTSVVEVPASTGPEKDQRADREALRELLRPVRGRTRVAVAVQAVGAVAEIVPYVAIGEIARELLEGDGDPARLRTVAVVVVLALGVRALCASAAIMITHFADDHLQAVLRRRLVARLGRVPLGWFDARTSGQVKTAADEDVHALHYLVAHNAVETTAGVMVPLVGLAYLCTVDWRLALVALLPLPLYGIAFAIMMRDSAAKIARMSEGTTRVNAAIVEFVRGIGVVKAFGRAGEAHAAYRHATDDFARFFGGWVGPMLRLEAVSSMALAPPFVLVLNLGFGLWFVERGWVGPVDVLIASIVGLVVPSTVATLSHGMQARIEAAAAASRLTHLLATPEVPDVPHPQVPDGSCVELAGVGFSYDGDSAALTDVTLRLEPGTVTAVVGSSGSGKSTLASLVLRFHDVDAGAVLLGGVDVRRLAADDLYRRVGFVLQDVQLLDASVHDNIALSRPGASRQEVERVARAAQVHDRILRLPRGYDSVVGVDARLSGGEAQRVSIARALMHDPPVLVLDEATAFADPDVEAEVQAALSVLVRGRSLLVVAHRLETIVDADQIAVLERGRLVERGRHDELLARGGVYAGLWAAQEGMRS